MKIAVLSDTHMPKRAKEIPLTVLEGIKDSDLIIHAGDWTSLEVYEELKKVAPVKGVWGNVDPPEVQQYFPEKIIIKQKQFRIGIVHGHQGKKRTTPERAFEAFKDEKLDIIVFGHSHIPYINKMQDTILFNPGSPTDKRFQTNFSYGIIHLNDSIVPEHCFFTKKN